MDVLLRTKDPDAIIDEIFALFARYGEQTYGEGVTQREHAVQVGQRAREAGYGDEIVLAAFLHDVGHLCGAASEAAPMGGFGVQRHDRIGAQYLRDRGFSDTVATLVEGHVEAKRYLTYKDPGYYAKLSEASRETLRYQGGPMQAEEAAAFEAHPLFARCIELRTWDEEGKRTDLDLDDLTFFRDAMRRHLTGRAG